MSAHTPGPWGVEQTDRDSWIGPMRADGKKVAEIVTNIDRGPGYSEEFVAHQDANARLIAAAPELLGALEAILPFAQHADNCGDADAYNNATVQTCGCGLDATLALVQAAIFKATGEA